MPAVTAAVADEMLSENSCTETEIDAFVSPGHHTPRGVATIKSVLSYCGQSIRRLEEGRWNNNVVGWQGGAHLRHFPGLDRPRLVAPCNVPDLDIFPERYAPMHTCRFWAGLESRLLMSGIWMLAWAVQMGILPVGWASKYAGPLKRMSDLLLPNAFVGTPDGALEVEIRANSSGDTLKTKWSLFAGDSKGPLIPCLPSVLVATKLSSGSFAPGARPCVGFFNLYELQTQLAAHPEATSDRHWSAVPLEPIDVDAVPAPTFTSFVNHNMDDNSVFARGLGEFAFEKMPPNFRSVFGNGGVCVGSLNVMSGTGMLSKIVALLAGMPRGDPCSGTLYEVAVEIEGSADGSSSAWTRRFSRGPTVSSEWKTAGGYAAERIKVLGIFPVTLGFLLQPLWSSTGNDENVTFIGFRHTTKRMHVCGVPVPRALAMTADGITTVVAKEGGTDKMMGVSVDVKHPWLGRIVRYDGVLEIDTREPWIASKRADF